MDGNGFCRPAKVSSSSYGMHVSSSFTENVWMVTAFAAQGGAAPRRNQPSGTAFSSTNYY